MKAPIYIVKPKNIFRHPFNKFDLDKPMNRDTQNDDITDYFNYGFNEDTMVIYSKLVKRTLEVLQQSVNPTYFDAPSELMRLNDQIPMDFGGFCKFFDTSIFLNPEATQQELKYMIDYHNGQRVFQFLVFIATSSKTKNVQYPLIEFVKYMYKNNNETESFEIRDAMDQIQQNLQRKYQQTMKKLIQKKNNPGGTNGASTNVTNERQQGMKQKKASQASSGILKQLAKNTKMQQDNQKKQQMSNSDSQSSSEDSSSSSSSEDSRQKKKNKKRSKSQSKTKKDKKDKNKKIKKQDKRSRSREKGKDRRDKDKRKQKSRKKSKDRDRDREREKERQRDRDRQRKQKSKKRRN